MVGKCSLNIITHKNILAYPHNKNTNVQKAFLSYASPKLKIIILNLIFADKTLHQQFQKLGYHSMLDFLF